MDLKFFPTQIFTYTGSEKAKLFKSFAFSKLRAVVEEASFNNFYQHKREFVLIPGFVITAGVVGGNQFVNVYLAEDSVTAAEKLFATQQIKQKKFQTITVKSLAWTAGVGNPTFPRSTFLIGDSAELTVAGGLSGNAVAIAKSTGNSLFTLSAVTRLTSNTYKVTITITGDGLFGVVLKQLGSSEYYPAANLTLTWNSDDVVPVIDISKIKQPFSMAYDATVAYEVGNLEYIATAKRGGTLVWSVLTFDHTLLAAAYFADTTDTPPKPYLHVAFNANCQYGLSYVEIKVTETANGVSKDSDSVIVLIERQDHSSPTLTANSDGSLITVANGVRPYTWVLGGWSLYNISLGYGAGGSPRIVNGQMTDVSDNGLVLGTGACQNGGYVRVTDACGREAVVAIYNFGIPGCVPRNPLVITQTSSSTIHVTGGTQFASGNKYVAEFYPQKTTGGVSIWATNGGTDFAMTTNGCFCTGSGIKITDADGSTAFIPFELGSFGPIVKCITGCGGSGGGGGGGSGTWLTVYDGAAAGNGPWICAPIGSGFEGCSSYTSRSNDGKFTLTWGYGYAVADNYGWMTMLAGFNAWCIANNRQSDYAELTEADFNLVESFKLGNEVGYHCAVLQMLG